MRTSKVSFFIVFALLFQANLPAAAQPPDTLWTKTFGGDGNDCGYCVKQTRDGGYVIVGCMATIGSGSSVYLIKTDSSGNQVWQRTFGVYSYNYGFDVKQTSDGGYIITGSSAPYGSNPYIYLIKTDIEGILIWQHTFSGGICGGSGHGVLQTSDGGYIITGNTYSYSALHDVCLIKTDSLGNQIWQRTFGGGDDYGCSVLQASDGGYIIAGYTWQLGAGGSDVYLIKTDSSGNSIWQNTYGGNECDYGYSVVQTADNGYAIVGETHSYGADVYDVYLLKTDSSGNQLWQSTFGGTSGDAGYSLYPTSDGGYIITGFTYSSSARYYVYLIKTDSMGNLVWQRAFGWSNIYVDLGYSVLQSSDGGYIIAGITCPSNPELADVYLIKTDADGTPVMPESPPSTLPSHFSLYSPSPNPFNAVTTLSYDLPTASQVKLQVYDTAGRLVTTLSDGIRPAGSHQVTWNVAGQPSGIYFCRLQAGENTNIQKIVLLK